MDFLMHFEIYFFFSLKDLDLLKLLFWELGLGSQEYHVFDIKRIWNKWLD